MAEKFDYKKEYRDLYLPGKKPALVEVPAMRFIMVDGSGEPQGADYQSAMQILYGLSFTIKMSKKSGAAPGGYFEYVVPPLEGLWWSPGGQLDLDAREGWRWTSMIRQPDFVTEEIFSRAVEDCRVKKPEIDVSRARFEVFTEGLCVQMMHLGPYSGEAATMDSIHAYLAENGLRDVSGTERKHHEIYLSDPRRTTPDRMKTVIRLPVVR